MILTLYEHAAPALFYFVENIIPFFVHKSYLMIKWEKEEEGDNDEDNDEHDGYDEDENGWERERCIRGEFDHTSCRNSVI